MNRSITVSNGSAGGFVTEDDSSAPADQTRVVARIEHRMKRLLLVEDDRSPGATLREGSEIIKNWPEDAREPAQFVIDKYGEPDEVTETLLTWHKVGPWKRVTASRKVHLHNFPVPHWDAFESVIDYRVPVEFISQLVEFDGSVTIKHTAGEASAQCHDEEANSLALSLMHDMVTGKKTVQQARAYLAPITRKSFSITGASCRRPT